MFSGGTITCYVGETQVPVGDSIPAEDCNTWLATSYLGMYIALALLSLSLPVPLSTSTCTEDGTFACTERECCKSNIKISLNIAMRTIFFCEAPVGQCSQPIDIGPCDNVFPSWFYNSTSGECERFNYGGCGGNDNRFETKLECQGGCDENFGKK